jgi:PhzF family phenazine biosynthesis protein
MEIPIYQVDAFTDRVFGGNPAAVCPLTDWLPEATMQAIAAENNLAETAFFVEEGGRYRLRWFTPTVEVPLCGHATLAAAYVIFRHLAPERAEVRFDSASGELKVTREGERLTLDFPAQPASPAPAPERLSEALGAHPLDVRKARYWMAVFAREEDVAGLRPDMRILGGMEPVICTAPGGEVDFVSRFFAPSSGIDEDPVTGSAHCTLVPYWARRLGRNSMQARQISARGGKLWVELAGERVRMSGFAAPYLKGVISV